MFTLHQVDKDGHVSTPSIIYTIEVHSYSKLVFVLMLINRGTEESYGLSIATQLSSLLNFWYFQNKTCFPWIRLVPGGLLWLTPENKTTFITYFYITLLPLI